MEKIIFVGDHLEDEQGRIIECSYEDLLNACHKDFYENLNIAGIITQAVSTLLGVKCPKRSDLRDQSLFCKLENYIRNTPEYIKSKYVIEVRQADQRRDYNETKKRNFNESISSYIFWEY